MRTLISFPYLSAILYIWRICYSARHDQLRRGEICVVVHFRRVESWHLSTINCKWYKFPWHDRTAWQLVFHCVISVATGVQATTGKRMDGWYFSVHIFWGSGSLEVKTHTRLVYQKSHRFVNIHYTYISMWKSCFKGFVLLLINSSFCAPVFFSNRLYVYIIDM